MLNPTLVAAISTDYAGLVALFTRKLGDRALAEDLVNQAYVESLPKLAADRIADPSRFSGFVYRVAFNLLRNHRRRMDNRSDMRASSLTLENLAGDGSPVEQLFRDGIVQQVRRVVMELPIARDRDIVRRYYLEEQSKNVICRELGLTPGHFDKVVFRARKRMKQLLVEGGVEYIDRVEKAPRQRPAYIAPAAQLQPSLDC